MGELLVACMHMHMCEYVYECVCVCMQVCVYMEISVDMCMRTTPIQLDPRAQAAAGSGANKSVMDGLKDQWKSILLVHAECVRQEEQVTRPVCRCSS